MSVCKFGCLLFRNDLPAEFPENELVKAEGGQTKYSCDFDLSLLTQSTLFMNTIIT